MKGWSGCTDNDLSPRLALQMVHEAAMCVNRIRPLNTFCHQGFEIINGLPYIATDKEIHKLLDEHTIAQAQALQIALGKISKESL